MTHYKVTYFNFKGRGEFLRYLLTYMKIDFEDFRINYDDWLEKKSSYPFGKLPVLEIDGKVYYQSLAIGRYLAKKAGLRGKTELDDLHIDAISDTIDDFVSQFPWYTDERTKMKEYMDKNGPTVLSGLEKELGDRKWFAGDYLTWADFFWDISYDGIEHYVPGFLKDYPKLTALRGRVQEVPEIAAWIKRRPQDPY